MPVAKVSCLCLTRNRPKFLHRAISCFQRQTWMNRELVVVYDSDDKRTIKMLEHYKNKHDIKLVQNVKKKPSVGFLRNLAVSNANGEYVIQWDDDDFYEDNRISFMMNRLMNSKKPAIVLNSWYCVFVKRGRIRQANPYTYEGTILAKKRLLMKFKYPDYTRKKVGNTEVGEDTFVINQLRERKLLHVVNKPELYYYFIHGDNTCSPKHFQEMFKNSRPIKGSHHVFKKLQDRLKADDKKFAALSLV